jgi:hypothetical protein
MLGQFVYSEPKSTDICVCFCWFNPAGRIRPLQNLLLFKSRLEVAKIPFFSIECLFGQAGPTLPDATLRVRAPSPLFYKEALWNRLEQAIPEKYKYLIFCDTDILVSEGGWVDQIREALQTSCIVQPFERVVRLDANMIRQSEEKGSIAEILKGRTYTVGGTAPGFCWALRRDTFREIRGFYDKNLMGCGDQSFAHALLNQIPPLEKGRHPAHFPFYQAYRAKIAQIQPSFTYLPFTLTHLWHGALQNRQYEKRLSWFDGLEDWEKSFTLSEEGLWIVLSKEKQQEALEYFIRREEDMVSSLPGAALTAPPKAAKAGKPGFFEKFPNLRSS